MTSLFTVVAHLSAEDAERKLFLKKRFGALFDLRGGEGAGGGGGWLAGFAASAGARALSQARPPLCGALNTRSSGI